MSEFLVVFSIRQIVLFTGALICLIGGGGVLRFSMNLKGMDIGKFLNILSLSVVILGLVQLLIALGNVLFYFFPYDWAYGFLVSAGLLGIVLIVLFIWGYKSIYRYVVMK